jgi:hypothetical protein
MQVDDLLAWRQPDGRYVIRVGAPPGWFAGTTRAGWYMGTYTGTTRAADISSRGWWIVPEEEACELGAAKVFGVVVSRSSCGCDPAGFRWATEKEVQVGRTEPMFCTRCRPGTSVYSHHDIIDVCGEADVAEAVYEAEFRTKLG